MIIGMVHISHSGAVLAKEQIVVTDLPRQLQPISEGQLTPELFQCPFFPFLQVRHEATGSADNRRYSLFVAHGAEQVLHA